MVMQNLHFHNPNRNWIRHRSCIISPRRGRRARICDHLRNKKMHTSLPNVGFCNEIWLQSMHTFFIFMSNFSLLPSREFPLQFLRFTPTVLILVGTTVDNQPMMSPRYAAQFFHKLWKILYCSFFYNDLGWRIIAPFRILLL